MFERMTVDDLRFLGAHFQRARKALGLKRKALVRQAGYQNINKGLRRITHLENGKAPLADAPTLKRFADVLDLDLGALFAQIRERLAQRRAQEHERQKPWLATLLVKAREHKGWSIEQVIARAGLSPAEKFERRLEHLESGEHRFPVAAELEALADALDIPRDAARAAYARECEFYDGLDEKPQIIERLMPAIYIPQKYPEDLDTEQILRFAVASSAARGRKVCVELPEGRAVYIEPDGHRFESRRGPQMYIR